MKGDIIANGIIGAATKIGIKVPIVVRLTGTNSEEGKSIINEFAQKNKEYNFIAVNELDEAANVAVKLSK